jgi:hypothetical protein
MSDDHGHDHDDDIDIDDIVDSFFDAREAIFEHVGYVEDWRVLPIDDSRDQFWAVDEHEREWVKFSPSREALAYWLESDDYGPHGDKLYENEIYTQRHLKKWVYRGDELTLVVADTRTDGNQYLQLFRNHNEVHPGETAEPVESMSTEEPEPTEHPLNQAIDHMIEADRKAHADSLIAKVRTMCAEALLVDLQAAIAAHRASCQQPDCLVLAAMEETAAAAVP